jgi:hypothetical protein
MTSITSSDDGASTRAAGSPDASTDTGPATRPGAGRRWRRPPSPAMVVAVIALVIAMGGSAYAVGSTINGSQLQNRSVAAIKLEKQTLTGTEINKSKLGQVPSAANAVHANLAANANALGGVAAAGFVHGAGHRLFARLILSPAATSDHELLNVPGLVDVHAGCLNSSSPPTTVFNATNTSGHTIDVVRTEFSHSNGDPVFTDGFTVAPLAQAGGATNVDGSTVLRVGEGTGATAKLAIVTFWFTDDNGTCDVNAEADYNR